MKVRERRRKVRERRGKGGEKEEERRWKEGEEEAGEKRKVRGGRKEGKKMEEYEERIVKRIPCYFSANKLFIMFSFLFFVSDSDNINI